MGRAAAGGRGALPGAAHPGSCAVRPSVCPQALSEPVEPPEPWAAGASRAQVSGCPWGEGTKRSLRRVGVSKEPRGLRSSACATGGPGGGGAAPGGWAPNPGLREESAQGPGRLRGPKYGPKREEAGARALESWYREWGCRGRGALTPAHHLPAPGCSPSPPASPGLYCSGRCCCCSWGQRLPRIRRSPTATRWGPWGHWPGMGWAGTQTRILGWLLLGKILPFSGWWSSWGHCLEQSREGGQAQGPGLGLSWRGQGVNTGHHWSPCRNAQMAMSGTPTASTAGVSVPG